MCRPTFCLIGSTNGNYDDSLRLILCLVKRRCVVIPWMHLHRFIRTEISRSRLSPPPYAQKSRNEMPFRKAQQASSSTALNVFVAVSQSHTHTLTACHTPQHQLNVSQSNFQQFSGGFYNQQTRKSAAIRTESIIFTLGNHEQLDLEPGLQRNFSSLCWPFLRYTLSSSPISTEHARNRLQVTRVEQTKLIWRSKLMKIDEKLNTSVIPTQSQKRVYIFDVSKSVSFCRITFSPSLN